MEGDYPFLTKPDPTQASTDAPLELLAAPKPTAESLEDWKNDIDPSTCKAGQYTISVALTSAAIPDGESCLAYNNTASPQVFFAIGTTTMRSDVKNGQQYPAYLETFHFGCQNAEDPLQITLINDLNQDTCLSSDLEGWSLGRESALEEATNDKSKVGKLAFSASDMMQNYPFTVTSLDGAATIDMTVVAQPGPPIVKSTWNQHTPGDVSAIVIGMLSFLLMVAVFIWRVKNQSAGAANSAAGAASAPSAATAAEPSAPPAKVAAGAHDVVADSA